MFSPHLYTHKFDIDDLIRALLSGAAMHLNTTTGALTPQPDASADPAHAFTLPPLPPTWLATLTDHDFFPRLTPSDKAELQTLISQNQPLHMLIPFAYGPTTFGGWLRERVKEEALQWLANNNLIPPSMRHISGVPKPRATNPTGPVKKVTIS